MNPSVNIYHSLSRACFQSNAASLQELIENHSNNGKTSSRNESRRGMETTAVSGIDLNDRVFRGVPYVFDTVLASTSTAQSLITLAVKYSNRRITRLLLEHGVDVESDDLYAIALRGQWRDDWIEKADMLIEAAEVSVSDPQKLLRDYRLFYLPRIMHLIAYLRDSDNWYCFENLLRVCHEQHRRLIPGEICDSEKKAMDRLLARYSWMFQDDEDESKKNISPLRCMSAIEFG